MGRELGYGIFGFLTTEIREGTEERKVQQDVSATLYCHGNADQPGADPDC